MPSRKQLIADAMVVDGRGRVFVQRRSSTRRLFPGCWDLIGGHVGDDEDVLSALRREIHEETGWYLKNIVLELTPKYWSYGPTPYEERQFIVTVDGDLTTPTLETDKVSETLWVDRTNVEKLKENRKPDDQLIYNSVVEALKALETVRPRI
ncbi:NUDIX domain-containing protein [Bradyrhizobium centrosematis]|uniref:NUDIX domain-containing protein n=1 Tax=Bradyrhizobium centrosematis TaxID=1300039 RepID=UPI00388E5968